MSLFLDTSCLLKEVLLEPESSRVLGLVALESRVVVTTLTRLEARLAIESLMVGGRWKRRQVVRAVVELDRLLATAPHEVVRFPADALDVALAQIGSVGSARYCRALDRIHLGSMQALGLRRILTNDSAQAEAANALAFDVITPAS